MSEVKHILNGYIPFAKTIGKMFGPQCEVVIHNLTTPQSSVMFTVNGHVTGRKVGQSFDHLVDKVLLSNEFEEDYLAGYEIQAADGRPIKSSTTLIRDTDNKVVGAFCINYDIGLMNQMQEMIDAFMPDHHQVSEVENGHSDEADLQNVEEITDQLIAQIVNDRRYSLNKRHEKIELIRFMDEKGIFLMKGAVDKVAEQLGISKVTVYSYLDEVKKQSNK